MKTPLRKHELEKRIEAALGDSEIIDVVLSFALEGTCPVCEEDLDLMESSEVAPIVRANAKSGSLSGLNGTVVACPECGSDLMLDVII